MVEVIKIKIIALGINLKKFIILFYIHFIIIICYIILKNKIHV